MFSIKNILYVAWVIIYLMHNDIWFWDNPTLILGIPIGLFYHVMYCLAASMMLFLLIRYAWPKIVSEVDVDNDNSNVQDNS
jgi:TRAP-type C4-dicarboxylate transport system permease small subunit